MPTLSAPERKHFGEQVTYLLQVMSAYFPTMRDATRRAGERLGTSPETIYKWRQGNATPVHPEAYERLARLGAEYGLDRAWARSLLGAGRVPGADALVARVYADDGIAIRYNLPRPVTAFVGRQAEIERVKRFLRTDDPHGCMGLFGEPGCGKTALVNKVAWELVSAPRPVGDRDRFDAVLWASAQQHHLVISAGKYSLQDAAASFRSLDDLYHLLAAHLGESVPGSGPAGAVSPSERLEQLKLRLKVLLSLHGRVLLVLDGLEHADDPAILDFLHELPMTCKAVVTSRFPLDLPLALRIEPLAPEHMRQLIERECESLQVDLTADEKDYLLSASQSNPATAYLLLRLHAVTGSGLEPGSLESITAASAQANGTKAIYDFFYKLSMERLRQTTVGALSHLLMHLLSFFLPATGATVSMLTTIINEINAGDNQGREAQGGSMPILLEPIEEEACARALSPLLRLGLVRRVEAHAPDTSERFALSPFLALTLELEESGDQISTAQPVDRRALREQWLASYKTLARLCATDDNQDPGTLLAEWGNFCRVSAWCARVGRVHDLAYFWVGRLVEPRGGARHDLAELVGVPAGGMLGQFAEADARRRKDQTQFLRDIIALTQPGPDADSGGLFRPDYHWAAMLKLAHVFTLDAYEWEREHTHHADGAHSAEWNPWTARIQRLLAECEQEQAPKGMGQPFVDLYRQVRADLADVALATADAAIAPRWRQ